MLIASVWAFLKGANSHWIAAGAGAIAAFALLILVTASMLLLKGKQSKSTRKGRRGLLDWQRDIEQVLNELPGHLDALSERLNTITRLANKSQRRLTRLSQSSGNVASKTHRQATIAAGNFLKQADFLKVRGDVIGQDLAILNQSMGELLVWAMANGGKDQLVFISILCEKLMPSTKAAIDGLASFRDGTDSIRNNSEQLDIAGGDLRASADHIIQILSDSCVFFEQTLKKLSVDNA